MFRPTCRSSSGLSSLVSGECYACGVVLLDCTVLAVTYMFCCVGRVFVWRFFGVVGRFFTKTKMKTLPTQQNM
jgi:hypothetical protein